MINWEKTLNQTYTIKQWQSAIRSIYKFSHCTNHWEMTIKITNRWHFTPYRLAKMIPSISPLCWRECGKVGTIQHILWECPSITGFWNSIFQCIASCTGILSPPKAELAMLNLNIDSYPFMYRQLITHLLLAARTLILRNWKSTLIPNLSEAIALVNDNYSFEKAISVNNLTYHKFQKSWSAWPYISPNNRLSWVEIYYTIYLLLGRELAVTSLDPVTWSHYGFRDEGGVSPQLS